MIFLSSFSRPAYILKGRASDGLQRRDKGQGLAHVRGKAIDLRRHDSRNAARSGRSLRRNRAAQLRLQCRELSCHVGFSGDLWVEVCMGRHSEY